VAPGASETVAAVWRARPGWLRQYDAAAASHAQAERLAAGGCFALIAVPWRWLEVTMLVLPGHLAAEQA
jgi:hypothetical protein